MKKLETLKSSIIKLRLKGLTINEIREELHCSKSTISFHLNNNNMGGVLKRDENLNIDIEKIIKLRKDGLTYKEIRNSVDLSLDKITKICKENNLSQSFRNQYKHIDKSMIKNINLVYNELKNIKKTSEKLNISRSTIRKHLYKLIDRKKDPLTRKKKMVEYVSEARKRRKTKLILYKGGKCQNCNYNKVNGALQFHHLDPTKKDFTIGGRNYSWEKMKKEVDKCILVCSNCHYEIHDEIRNSGFSLIVDKIIKI